MIQPHKALAMSAALLMFAARHACGANGALQGCLGEWTEQADFSGVVAATERGQSVVFLARGKLAGEASAAITPQTRFNLGSASKMFTAVAVGQLIDSRKVRLDDAVGVFVPGLTAEASRVTVRQLLTHSAGLGDFFRPQNMATMMKARTATDLMPLIALDKPAFPPGSRFEYSNSGFAILGILIERVSGLSYGDYLARYVFARAGMTDTGLDPQPLATLAIGMTALQPGMAPQTARSGSGAALIEPALPRMAPSGVGDRAGSSDHGVLRGPDMRPERVVAAQNPALHPAPGASEGYGSPAGGLFSTARDMQKFAQALLDHRLTTARTAAALTAPQIIVAPATADRPERRYGLGFGVGTEQGRKWFGHSGGTLGANTEFSVFPGRQLTLIVLSNRDPPMASRMFANLRQLVLNPRPRATCPRARLQ